MQAGINNVKSATDKNIDSLLKQASALEANTRFSDEAVVSAQGILTTFQLNQRAIAALTPRLLDMSEGLARVTGEMPDLEGNAILVAKALGGEDVVGLVGALRRVGVVMTQAQTEMLQTGNMEQRLATITKVLDQNFKGMSEAAGSTGAGAMAKLRNAINNLQEQFGGAISKAIIPFIERLTNWARTDKARQTMQDIATATVAVAKALIAMISAIKDAIYYWQQFARNVRENGPSAGFTRFGPFVIPKFQHGGISSGGPAIVGEKGPELVNLPRGANVTPNHQLPSMGSTINFNVNVGMFAGNPMERRKIAETLFNDLRDIADSKGISLGKMVSRA